MVTKPSIEPSRSREPEGIVSTWYLQPVLCSAGTSRNVPVNGASPKSRSTATEGGSPDGWGDEGPLSEVHVTRASARAGETVQRMIRWRRCMANRFPGGGWPSDDTTNIMLCKG